MSDFMVCQKQRRHHTQVSHNAALRCKFPAGGKLWRLKAERLRHGNTFPTTKRDTTGNGFTDFSPGLGGPISVSSV